MPVASPTPCLAAFDTGGLILGRGPDVDTVPAIPPRVEYVVRRRAVDALGVGLLDKLNRAGPAAAERLRELLANFNTGGLVDAVRVVASPVAMPTVPRVAFNGGGAVEAMRQALAPADDPFFDRRDKRPAPTFTTSSDEINRLAGDPERFVLEVVAWGGYRRD